MFVGVGSTNCVGLFTLLLVFHSFAFLLLLFYIGDEGVQLETKSGKALGVLLDVSL